MRSSSQSQDFHLYDSAQSQAPRTKTCAETTRNQLTEVTAAFRGVHDSILITNYYELETFKRRALTEDAKKRSFHILQHHGVTLNLMGIMFFTPTIPHLFSPPLSACFRPLVPEAGLQSHTCGRWFGGGGGVGGASVGGLQGSALAVPPGS